MFLDFQQIYHIIQRIFGLSIQLIIWVVEIGQTQRFHLQQVN